MDGAVDRVITGAAIAPSPANGEVIRPGFVAISGSRVAAVGPMSEAEPWMSRAAAVQDAPWAFVMPGLVNAHSHVAAGIFRGLLDEGVAGRGLYDLAFPMEQRFTPDDIYWLGLLGCIEVLKAGCTTINDIYFFADRLADAVEEIGMRAVIAEKMFDVNLPSIGSSDYTRYPERRTQKLAASLALAERRHGTANGRITVRMGTHATDTLAEGFLREAAAEARRLGIGVHIHVAQSPIEVGHIREAHDCTPIEWLDKVGLLGPDTIAAHCTLNTDSDIERMAATDTAYAVCPTIYARRGRFPRFWEMVKRGVRTGFGTDWIRMDPWEGMRNGSLVARLMQQDPDTMPAAEALGLHTLGGARALNLDGEIGTLEPGKKADLILVNVERPHIQPFYGDLPGIFYTTYPSDVDTVIVDGKTVVEGGRVTTVDEATVLAEVKRRIPEWVGWREDVQAARAATAG